MEAQGIAALFIELKVIALGLFVSGLGIDHFHHSFKAAKPGGNCSLEVDQNVVMFAGVTVIGTNGDGQVLSAKAVGYK